MKVGGNTSATEFFTRHGGTSLLSDTDTKKKYSSRTADLYKEELAKRVKEDTTKYVLLNTPLLMTLIPDVRFPTRIVVEGMELSQPSDSTPQAEDDFFSSWDKSAPVKPASPSTATAPPVVGRPAPRMVTSSSLRSTSSSTGNSSAKQGASRLNSSVPAATASTNVSTAAKKSKLGGLGAKKAATPIDFAEAERKATEEAERIKQLGYDRQREEEEEHARQQAEKAAQADAKAKAVNTHPTTSPIPGKVDVQKVNNQDLERLGMGFRKFGFGGVPTPSQTASSRQSTCVANHQLIFEPSAKKQLLLLAQKLMTHPRRHGRNSERRRQFRPICFSDATITILLSSMSRNNDYPISKGQPRSPRVNTLAAKRKMNSNAAGPMEAFWGTAALRI